MNLRLLLIACLLFLLPATIIARVVTGSERTPLYLPLLEGKRVALMSNHTGITGSIHTLDHLIENGVDVTTIFSPEHGFRGTASAGEHVGSSVDPETGIPIASLYDGKTRTPSQATMDSFDVLVVDIQDVGTRFYTYYITMLDLMNASARHGKQVVIFDRPNPNGMTVDGPILRPEYYSGVGRLPIPVMHGMTLGELAQMIVGEGWLDNSATLDLTVIPCEGYTHSTRYELPVPPSPNLPDMTAIYLYPSLCYFEATEASIGRGTDHPFTIYGHPLMKGPYSFTPHNKPGAANPPCRDRLCHGYDLSTLSHDSIIAAGINLEYLLRAYCQLKGRTGASSKNGKASSGPFLTKFFEKLIGTPEVRRQIAASGLNASSTDKDIADVARSISRSWQSEVESFRRQRAPYLLYAE